MLNGLFNRSKQTRWIAISIEIDNDPLRNAKIHNNSTGPDDDSGS